MVFYIPSFLNKAMILFLILSSTRPLLLLIAASPSSLYSPTLSLPIKLDTSSRRYKPTSSQILVPSKVSIVTSNNVLSSFLTQVQSSSSDSCKIYHSCCCVDNATVFLFIYLLTAPENLKHFQTLYYRFN